MCKLVCLLYFVVLGAILSGAVYELEILFQDDLGSHGMLASTKNQVCYITSDSLIFWGLDAEGRFARSRSIGRPSDEWVSDAALTAGGDIWMTSEAGLVKYSSLGWNNYPEIQDGYIVVGSSDELWIAGWTGLMKFNGTNFKNVVNDFDWQTQAFGATCLQIDRNGFLWIGVMGPGITRFNGTELDNGLGVPTGPPSDEPGQDDAAPNFICFDADNNPWVDYPLGVACWKNGTWMEHDLTQYGFEWGVGHLAVDDQGVIWASDGGKNLLCFDGTSWFEPKFTGKDIPKNTQKDLSVQAMIPGPANSMIFVLTSEAAKMQSVFVGKPIELKQATCPSENLHTAKRSYPPPVQNNYIVEISRDGQNLKNPVKSVFSQQIELPTYYSYDEFYPDGKIKKSGGGRSMMNSETSYWYNDQGCLSREQTIEYGNGEELDNSRTLFQYEYDELGYPVKVTRTSNYGEFTDESQFVYVYADTTYSKEWRDEPSEYSPGYVHRETYDSKGRIVLKMATKLDNGTFEQSSYSYIPDRQMTIEEYEWDGSRFNKKEITIHNPNGAVMEWTLYDVSGKLLVKQANTLDANGHLVSSVYYNAEEGTTSRSKFEYTFDAYGNPLSVVCTVDGEVDYEQSSTETYEYYQ